MHSGITRALLRLSACLALFTICAASSQAAVTSAYRARSINGNQAPPPYGMRLDGFIDGNATTEVTFHFDEVYLEEFDDSTARLYGTATVAEVNTVSAPAADDVGAGPLTGDIYQLDVRFDLITGPAEIALIEGYRADWNYYDIDPDGIEMQNLGDASDSTHLWTYPAVGNKPFRVGKGANGKNQNFGASGWLSYEHHVQDTVYGGGDGVYLNASDFLMNLEEACANCGPRIVWGSDSVTVSDTTVRQCNVEEICVPYEITDVGSGGVTVTLESGPGVLDTAGQQVCFTPPDTGEYCLVIRVTDSQGRWDESTVCITVEWNQAPFIIPPAPRASIICLPEDSVICTEGWVVGDPDDDSLVYSTMGSGVFDPVTGTFCSPVTSPGQYTQTLIVSDTCGATVKVTFTFEIVGPAPPVVDIQAPDTSLLCAADTVCVPVVVQSTDSLLEVSSNIGELVDGQLCWYADTSGSYLLILTAMDACGQTDADSAVVEVEINSPPYIEAPATSTLAYCVGDATACLTDPVLVGDTDGDSLTITVTPEGATWDPATGLVCLPTAGLTGSFDVIITAVDACEDSTTATVAVETQINTAPIITFSSPDTTVLVCDPDTSLCFFVAAEDGQGNQIIPEEVLVPGFYDAATGEFCFNPDSICFDHPETIDTTICVIFSATNECGTTLDSLCIQVVSKIPATVMTPADTALALCALGQICVGPVVIDNPDGGPLSIEPFGADYVDGTLCFTPPDTGTYFVGVTITDTCGNVSSDTTRVEVWLNEPPVIVAIDSARAGICGDQLVCVGPISIIDPEGDLFEVTVSNGGYIDTSSGDLCFFTEGSGTYEFEIAATDSCGTSYDTVTVEVDANLPPIWVQVPNEEVRQCVPGDSVCFEVIAEDLDGDELAYALALPGGGFEPFDGSYCFVPDTAGRYLFAVRAADSCNAPIEDTVRIDVRFNTLPELVFSIPDTTLTVCDPDTTICFFVGAIDADDDPVVIREILNPGSYDPETGEVCFNPAEVCFQDSTTTDTTICLIFGASDPCSLEVVDSVCIEIVLNRAPIVQLPPAPETALCAPGQICLDNVLVSDPDGDSLSIEVSDGAEYVDGSLCFFADTAGLYTVYLCATDPCGATTCDTTQVEVFLNSPPIVSFPSPIEYTNSCGPEQVCVPFPTIVDPDGEPVEIQVEGAVRDGDQLCLFAAAAGSYPVIVTATDSCGATGADTVDVVVRFNTPPRVLIRPPRPAHLCDIDTVLCYEVRVADIGELGAPTLRLVKTDTRMWSLEGDQLCLDASVALADRSSGTFFATIEATDACGAKDQTTVSVDLSVNQAPFALLPADTSAFLCEPGELCVGPVEYGDPDGEPLDVVVTGGTLVNDEICVQIAGDTTVLVTLTVTDSCGVTAADSMWVSGAINGPPIITVPEITSINLCALDSVCVNDIFGVDPELGTIQAELISGPGVFDPETGTLCFAPEADGTYDFTFRVEDGCVTVDSTWSVDVTINQPPTFVGPSPDTAVFACAPGDTVCLQFTAADSEGDVVTYGLVSGAGAIDPTTGLLCFAPDTSGRYKFIVSAEDSCEVATLDTGYATIQLNRPPELQFSSGDTTLYLCNPDTLLCWTVTATDPDGEEPVITEILNPGLFNPETGVFCFNPDSVCFNDPETVDTTICVIFAATDSCGAETIDSLCITMFRNRTPIVDLGPDTALFSCETGPLCLDLSGRVTDPDGDSLTLVATPPGYLSGDSLCVDVDTSGTYVLELCATDPCGLSDCDTLTLQITVNSAPVVILPPDDSVVACSVDSVCLGSVVIADPDEGNSLTVAVSGGAWLSGDQLCFVPDGDGDYTFVVTATDACGAGASDTVNVNVNLNDPPQLIFSSPDTTLTVCNSDTEICFMVTAVDADGDSVAVEEILVPGFYDPLTGGFCFNPDSICFGNPKPLPAVNCTTLPDGRNQLTVCMIFSATDDCGATTVDSLCVTVVDNLPPEIVFSSPDTSLFLCDFDTTLCFGVSAIDPEGDSVVITEILNPGAYFPETGIFCFNPDSVCFGDPLAASTSYCYTTEDGRRGLNLCLIFQATDACGNSSVDSLCLELIENQPPVVVAPDSASFILCNPGDELCVSPVYGLDLEDGILPVDVPGATYDALLQSLCFTADTAGVYVFTATTTDACGAQDTKQIIVTVTDNQPPFILLPADTALFVCDPDSACFDFVFGDPDGTAAIFEITGPAVYDSASGQLCVAVLQDSQPITVSVSVIDDCGALAADTFTIDPTLNSPPVVSLPPDAQTRVCDLGDYCIPAIVTDPDDNLAGPPQVTGGTWDADSSRVCIDVTGDGSYEVILSATDSCGITVADTATYEITVNLPPVTSFSVPDTSLYLCNPDTVLCFFFFGVDPEGGPVLLDEILNPGQFDPLTGEFCFNPGDVCFNDPAEIDTTICLIFSATDTCGAEVWDTLCLELTANKPPVVVAPADTTVTVCNGDSVCLNPFVISDPNGVKDTLVITSTGPAHVFDTASGVICFASSPGSYTFVVSATDRCGETDADSVTVTVQANAPPIVTLPPDFSQLVCVDSAVCFPVLVTDPGDSVTVEVVSGPGTYDPSTGDVCFGIDSSGLYTVVVRATDQCGASGEDTVNIDATLNSAPQFTVVPEIDTSFCFAPSQLCFTVTAVDPDGEAIAYALLEGPGAIDAGTGQVCWTPAGQSQLYTFVVQASDSCGAADVDTATVNVRINSAPEWIPPNDTVVAQCTPAQICYPPLVAADPDGDSVVFEILSGPGTINNGIYCFVPDTPGTAIYCATIRAVDACGAADTGQICSQVRLNLPPVLSVPDDFSQFACGTSEEICFGPVSASDPDGGPVSVDKILGPGTYDPDTRATCFTASSGTGDYLFVYAATDTCGAQVTDSVTVTVLVNRTPSLTVTGDNTACVDSQVCLQISGIDPDIGDLLTVTQLAGPAGTFVPSPLVAASPLAGQWCWTPDAAGSYQVVLQLADSCGATVVDTTTIDVSDFCDTLCFAAEIPLLCPDSSNPDNWLFQGLAAEFPVSVTVHRPVGAFDFLIGYDATALTVSDVVPGDDISAWEFFTFRLVDPATTCSGPCPSGLVRVIAIADINNGVPIADPSQTLPSPDPREFARIRFQVSNDRTLAGQAVNVGFWWNDCGDNTFSSPSGDLYVSNLVDPDTCLAGGGEEQIEACATFQDGGGCIPRAADIDDRGDLNLNGFAYEIADAVLYSNFFIIGPNVFDPDPLRRASQIAASDVNADGVTLTVADLVFLIRVILGLQEPIAGPVSARIGLPDMAAADVLWSGEGEGDATSFSLSAEDAVGALALRATVQAQVSEIVASADLEAAGMELKWSQTGSELNVLVFSMQGYALPAGEVELFSIIGASSLEEVTFDVSDATGRTMKASASSESVRPTGFELLANYPNPFNPQTEIRFRLHGEMEVSLSVFNVLGQPVSTLLDRKTLTAGEHRVVWTATDPSGRALPSGVYLYRLDAAGLSESRKMLLVR